MLADKVTRQTADTFDAAATFFDLTREWGTPDPEVLQKIKFAKWNAARILKAIREGKDPNESNPKRQEPEAETELDPADPDVQRLTASVEDVPDAGEPSDVRSAEPEPDQSYFPQTTATAPEPFVPSPLSQSPGIPPPPPGVQAATPGSPQIPPQPSPQIPTKLPTDLTPLVPSPALDPSAPPSWTTTPSAPHPATSNPPPTIPTSSGFPPSAPAPVPVAAAPSGGYVQDQKSLNQAQKHAKWAISALNFEDVPTAVQELRNALAVLGG